MTGVTKTRGDEGEAGEDGGAGAGWKGRGARAESV